MTQSHNKALYLGSEMPSLLVWSLHVCIKRLMHHAVRILYILKLSCLSSLHPQEALSALLLIVQWGKESSSYVKGAKNPLVM